MGKSVAIKVVGLTLALAGIATVSSQAAEPLVGESYGPAPQTFSYANVDDTVRIDASLGAMFLEGNEKVMVGNYTLSHLVWQSTTPVLRGSIAVDVGSGVSLRAEGSAAGFGSSYMEDYDWLKGNDAQANWSDRSQHSDTNLDHYFTGAASLGYELVKDATAVVRVHGGFKYSDVKWSAYGGSYVYSSTGGFRDQVGTFAPGTPGITYRQQFPELFLGFDGEEHFGSFRVGGLLRGGMTFLSKSTDDHWMRNLRFVDDLYVAPTVTAGADVGFALSPNAELTLAARYDHIFEQRGDTRYYNISNGAPTGGVINAASGGMRSAEITAGLRGSF